MTILQKWNQQKFSTKNYFVTTSMSTSEKNYKTSSASKILAKIKSCKKRLKNSKTKYKVSINLCKTTEIRNLLTKNHKIKCIRNNSLEFKSYRQTQSKTRKLKVCFRGSWRRSKNTSKRIQHLGLNTKEFRCMSYRKLISLKQNLSILQSNRW